jgi:hypothetical protein
VIVAAALHARYGVRWRAYQAYSDTLGEIASRRADLATQLDRHGLTAELVTTVGQLWTRAASERIFPAWYGTPYGFHGVAGRPSPRFPLAGLLQDVPANHERIACGHFVGSVLVALDFNVDRLVLGRQASGDVIRSFISEPSDPTLLAWLSGAERLDYRTRLRSMGDGLYLLGLSTHAGFLLVEDGRAWIVHASGFPPLCVVREPIERSPAMRTTGVIVVGKISDDRGLIRRWLRGERIRIRSSSGT